MAASLVIVQDEEMKFSSEDIIETSHVLGNKVKLTSFEFDEYNVLFTVDSLVNDYGCCRIEFRTNTTKYIFERRTPLLTCLHDNNGFYHIENVVIIKQQPYAHV